MAVERKGNVSQFIIIYTILRFSKFYNVQLILSIGKFDTIKNFAIGGMSGMIATSCVST